MSLKIKSQEDFWAGIMFIGFGIIAVVVSRDYPMGSAMRMGPGYFPTWLGIIMILMGSAVSAMAFKYEGEKVGKFAWKALLLLGLAFSIFAWAIDNIGFIPALFILIVLSAAAGQQFRVKEVLILSAVLIAGSWGLFIKGLELPFPLFWWR
ncbi:MAG: tripartite tricarboxylate transporter TctB family protein [Betaproteobacteria bacterium]|nr:tripartite tricarboxylate transporter TctB family protein [Betaproteobacteria bacterium]